MSIVEHLGLLMRAKLGRVQKYPWVGVVELIAWGSRGGKRFPGAPHHPYPRVLCTLPSFARIERLRWRPVELNDRRLRSHGKIGDCKQSIGHFCKGIKNRVRPSTPNKSISCSEGFIHAGIETYKLCFPLQETGKQRPLLSALFELCHVTNKKK